MILQTQNRLIPQLTILHNNFEKAKRMQENINILIVEDEEIWATNLMLYLNDFGYNITTIADNVEDALTALSKNDFDIALLDINLNGKNSGIELGKLAHNLYNKPFIFITASHDTHTLEEAAVAKPSAYLTKPVKRNSLFISIQNAIENFHQQKPATLADADNHAQHSFFVKAGNKYKKIVWSEVYCLSSDQKYTLIKVANDKADYFIRSTLQKTLQYIVPAHLKNKFIQINRAEVINVDFIEELSGEIVKTKEDSFEATESYIKDLKQALHIVS